MEIMMKQLGFSEVEERIKSENAAFINKLSSGKLTQQDVQDYKKLVSDYFDLEHDVIVRTEQRNKEDATKSVGERVFMWGKGRFSGLCHRAITPEGALVLVGMIVVGRLNKWTGGLIFKAIKVPAKRGLRLLKGTGNIAFRPVQYVFRRGVSGFDAGSNVVSKWVKLSAYPATSRGYSNFVDDFKAGRLSMDETSVILNNRPATRGNIVKKDELIRDAFGIVNKNELQLFENYFDHRSIRKILLNKSERNLCLQYLEQYESKLSTLTDPNKEAFLKTAFENGAFSKAGDIKNLTNAVDHIDFTQFSTPQEIEKAAKTF